MNALTHFANHDYQPIGQCCSCGVPTYDCDDLNAPCECGEGFIASVGLPSWRPCPPCLGSGRSLIWSRSLACPVCCGTGWITDANSEPAEDEAACVLRAITAYRHAGWPPHPDRLLKSKQGSISILRDRWSELELETLAGALTTLIRDFGEHLDLKSRFDMEAELGEGKVGRDEMKRLDDCARRVTGMGAARRHHRSTGAGGYRPPAPAPANGPATSARRKGGRP